MRTVTALDVRRRFGQIVDEAAAGERIVIERAGQPIAAIVPLSDVAQFDPEEIKARRLRAVEEIVRRAKRRPFTLAEPPDQMIRRMRDERTEQIWRAITGDSK
jgi:prevent-host-death family protein